MPARITRSPSDNINGLINIVDAHKLINDYATKINVSSSDLTRNPVLKHFYFDIKKALVDILLDPDKNSGANPDEFRIHLVMNLPNQMNCQESDMIENYLSILVCGINDDPGDPISLLAVNNLVLAEGFKDEDKVNFDDTCCVQGDPPRPLTV